MVRWKGVEKNYKLCKNEGKKWRILITIFEQFSLLQQISCRMIYTKEATVDEPSQRSG